MALDAKSWDRIALETVATLESAEPHATIQLMGSLATASISPDALPRSWGEDANGALSRIRAGGLVYQTSSRAWELTDTGRAELDQTDVVFGD